VARPKTYHAAHISASLVPWAPWASARREARTTVNAVLRQVGVEKLFPAKFAKIKSRQEALQTTFSVFLDIFYLQVVANLRKMQSIFQHPQTLSLPRVHATRRAAPAESAPNRQGWV
jgi:hypothetical protein